MRDRIKVMQIFEFEVVCETSYFDNVHYHSAFSFIIVSSFTKANSAVPKGLLKHKIWSYFFIDRHFAFICKNDQQFSECRKRNGNWKRIACINQDRCYLQI